jgi:hypothetical protein
MLNKRSATNLLVALLCCPVFYLKIKFQGPGYNPGLNLLQSPSLFLVLTIVFAVTPVVAFQQGSALAWLRCFAPIYLPIWVSFELVLLSAPVQFLNR